MQVLLNKSCFSPVPGLCCWFGLTHSCRWRQLFPESPFPWWPSRAITSEALRSVTSARTVFVSKSREKSPQCWCCSCWLLMSLHCCRRKCRKISTCTRYQLEWYLLCNHYKAFQGFSACNSSEFLGFACSVLNNNYSDCAASGRCIFHGAFGFPHFPRLMEMWELLVLVLEGCRCQQDLGVIDTSPNYPWCSPRDSLNSIKAAEFRVTSFWGNTFGFSSTRCIKPKSNLTSCHLSLPSDPSQLVQGVISWAISLESTFRLL